MPNLSLADKIVDASKTGSIVPELSALDVISDGGTIASGTTVSKITDASVGHTLNATFSNTEVQNALNALGRQINLLIDALEAFKISTST